MVSDTYDYWNMIDNILPACMDEIMAHNGKLLVRPDSGDIVDISVTTVEKLWKIFGGTINDKGYKVLDPHIGIIYGDGCTLANVEKIWTELEARGFAANNIVFGVGAFCFHGFFEDNKLIVLTRDTFGIAMKATYGEVGPTCFPIYKDPKTDTSKLKKSHKGCCAVVGTSGNYEVIDEFVGPVDDDKTVLQTVYMDGRSMNEVTFQQVRENLHGKRD
jgi:nicotinamide phosphoribosyltransferase